MRTRSAASSKKNRGQEVGKSPWIALVSVLIGGFIMAIAAGVIPIEQDPADAPPFIIGLAGFVFVAAGGAFMVEGRSAARAFWSMLILASMAGIGLWVAFWGNAENISGGLPFLPQHINAMLGKFMFGLGAVITIFMVIYAFRDGVRRMKERQRNTGT